MLATRQITDNTLGQRASEEAQNNYSSLLAESLLVIRAFTGMGSCCDREV